MCYANKLVLTQWDLPCGRGVQSHGGGTAEWIQPVVIHNRKRREVNTGCGSANSNCVTSKKSVLRCKSFTSVLTASRSRKDVCDHEQDRWGHRVYGDL
ncbi:hypothetical protein CHARACLAT_000676 [Characodon lateralis]|uniref:Uncharacterized protein n=1 Tax=Characodon lateralis TaxID=208331 RepID=A0ABU7CUB3_9TELE|nr:hypothetical protein [Characodon lateralis]